MDDIIFSLSRNDDVNCSHYRASVTDEYGAYVE